MSKIALCLALVISAFALNSVEACSCHNHASPYVAVVERTPIYITPRPQPVYYYPEPCYTETVYVQRRPVRRAPCFRPYRSNATFSFSFGL